MTNPARYEDMGLVDSRVRAALNPVGRSTKTVLMAAMIATATVSTAGIAVPSIAHAAPQVVPFKRSNRTMRRFARLSKNRTLSPVLLPERSTRPRSA